MNENKTEKPARPVGRYVKYALGEILLVMIGILLALQVNNWNEKRKTSAIEKEYLSSLLEECQVNLGTFKNQLNAREKELKQTNLLLNLLEYDSITSSQNEILSYMELIGWSNKIIILLNIWNEIRSSGKSDIISNRDLFQEVTRLYSGYERYLTILDEFERYTMNFREITAGVLPPRLRIEITNNFIQSIGANNFIYKLEVPFNFKTIVKNFRKVPKIGNSLADIIMLNEASISLNKSNISRIESVINSLKNELNLRYD